MLLTILWKELINLCKYRHDDKNVKLEIGDKYCEYILEYTNGANDLT